MNELVKLSLKIETIKWEASFRHCFFLFSHFFPGNQWNFKKNIHVLILSGSSFFFCQQLLNVYTVHFKSSITVSLQLQLILFLPAIVQTCKSAEAGDFFSCLSLECLLPFCLQIVCPLCLTSVLSESGLCLWGMNMFASQWTLQFPYYWDKESII